jgi:putative lipase involved disintegration of autophagic bodies
MNYKKESLEIVNFIKENLENLKSLLENDPADSNKSKFKFKVIKKMKNPPELKDASWEDYMNVKRIRVSESGPKLYVSGTEVVVTSDWAMSNLDSPAIIDREYIPELIAMLQKAYDEYEDHDDYFF